MSPVLPIKLLSEHSACAYSVLKYENLKSSILLSSTTPDESLDNNFTV